MKPLSDETELLLGQIFGWVVWCCCFVLSVLAAVLSSGQLLLGAIVAFVFGCFNALFERELKEKIAKGQIK